jgi:hypothetical protein
MTYDILKRMAGMVPTEINTDVAQDMYGQSFIDKSEEFLEANAGLNPDEKFRKWQRDIGNSWEFLASNRDYYYNTLESIHPGGKTAAREMVMDTLTFELSKKNTFQEREWELKKQARSLPSSGTEFGNEVWGLVNRELTSTKTLLDLQAMERARTSQAINLKHGLTNKSFTDLDPDVSPEAHMDDYLKGYRNNYGEEISVNEGRFSVPINGQAVPLFSLPDGTDDSVEQVLIDNIDLRPILKQKIQLDHSISQTKRLEEEKETISALFQKASTSEVPSQFRNNIIIDYAYDKPDGADITMKAVKERVANTKYTSTRDLVDDYKSQLLDIKDRVARRVSYGQ